MRRPSDRPTTLPDAVKDASARLDEVRRRQGRGAPALRGDGQVMELTTARGKPMLNPQGVNSGVRFDDDGMVSVASDGETTGTITGRTIYLEGNAVVCLSRDGAIRWADDGALEVVDSKGTTLIGMRTNRVHANLVNSNTDVTATNDLRAGRTCYADNFYVSGNAIRSGPFDNAVRWVSDGAFESVNGNGSQWRGVRCSSLAQVGATSWSWTKTDLQPLEDELGMPVGELVDRAAASVSGWRHDPEVVPDIATGRRRVGLMLDTLPSVLVDEQLVPERDDEGEETGEVLDRSGPDWPGITSALLVELANLRARVADLERRVPAAAGQ